MEFRNICQQYFRYLLKDGYEMLLEREKNCVEYKRKNIKIQLFFERQGYEISMYFTHIDGKSIRAYDILTYVNMDPRRGEYQISQKEELEKGVCYLAETLRCVLKHVDVSDELAFQELYDFSLKNQHDMLEKYQIRQDIKKAEECWKRHEYKKSEQLFKSHFKELSLSQKKKLEYLEKHNI